MFRLSKRDAMQIKKLLPILLAGLLLSSCQQEPTAKNSKAVEAIAQSKHQWTGIAVSNSNRIFVNFPFWSDNTPVSVAEIVDGKAVPYPTKNWNNRKKPDGFLAVQSVFIDSNNNLWVLDTRNPRFSGVDSIGPVLYRFNLQTDQLVKQYNFNNNHFVQNSYFNDVRIDNEKQTAYITDSGDGALIVLNLKTGNAKRVLNNHPATHAETDYLMINDKMWKNSVDADGIALSPDRKHLFFTALSGHTLYRIPTRALLKTLITDNELAASIDTVMHIPATDGMLFDDKGNLWMGGLENNSINVLQKNGNLVQMVQDSVIRWADSFSKDTAGNILFTTSQIHLQPENKKAYEVIKLKPSRLNPAPLNKILMVITSHGLLGETGDSTGYYLSEVSHAYYTFKEAGFQITFASPEGGKSPIDGKNMKDPLNKKFMTDKTAQKAIQNAIPANEVNPSDYRAIYYAGGHGTMWDFPQNSALQTASKKIYENGGIVSAVCHGPSGLVNIKLSDNNYLVNNKTVAGFTNEEEHAAGLEAVVPFLLESKLKTRGAKFEEAPIFQEKVVSDQRLVTGQNPASAKGAAEQIVRVLTFKNPQ
ncbi:Molecular chaperone Hsp31 and glyoxalase 3 [Salinivirga cyanobacteriivorans]|uniref:Molecular chaperone Hsp31 and glyoxalase 3 n=2 Tax=Salinivirga cyanobacteriivorans TaxID=1307839 RepID=A0A0S2HYX5_9BACT|nr:Molecular chaperone Hsp31 and glyoxalase 3 [Salinivirga cyanobacteriivorans]